MQTQKHRSGVAAGILLPMGLVCLFAFCALALALLGGQAYKAIQAEVDDSYGSTVAANYLSTKLSQNNRAGAIALRAESGLQVLVIGQEMGGEAYETRIYMKDGTLMEQFVQAGAAFSPAGGFAIAQLQSCTFELAGDGLLEIEIVSPGGTVTRTAFAVAEGGAAA